LGRVDCNQNIGRNARRSAWVADAAHGQCAESAIVRTNDVAFCSIWVVVIDAARTVWPLGWRRASDKITKRRYYDWAITQHRTLLNNKRRGRDKSVGSGVEHVAADVERIGVNAQRIIIQKFPGIAAADRVLLKEEEFPNRAVADYTVAGRIRNGEKDPVWMVSDMVIVGARNIDYLQEPTLRKSIVTNLRIAGEIHADSSAERRHHRRKEIVRVDVKHTVRRAGRLVETAQPAVDENNELSRASGAH